MQQTKIASNHLEVYLHLPGMPPVSERFDRAAVVEQVVLNGTHRFCEPEQVKPERVTCYGMGISGEFSGPGWAEQAAPGQLFPKLGVGLLTQRPEGGPHTVWRHYEIDPFETEVYLQEDRALFIQQPKPCMGIVARIYKELRVYRNTLTLSTMLENVGERALELTEYQHNFFSIDHLPVGPGYRLEVPFDGEISAIADATRTMVPGEKGELLPGALTAQGQTIVWNQPIVNSSFYKATESAGILPMARYGWKLSHEDSPCSVREDVSFVPARLAVWGIEHCICAEVFAPISVQPGGRQAYSRTWTFEDEQTNGTK